MSRIRFLLPAAFAAVTFSFATLASAQSADPPDRVARLAYLSGDVEFAPAGETTWGTADVNRPLITGDRLLTGSGGRAALELGDAALRINDDSAFNFLELNDTTSQVELSQGGVNLKVRRLQNGQTYEIDTPTAAFVAGEPGTYRVDVDPSGTGAMVTVFDGAGTVYGQDGASRPVAAGQSYRFDDPTLVNVTVNALPAPDDFDRFASARDTRYTNSPSRRYVSPDVIGYDDLDQYGDWQPSSDYGNVWYPSHVASDWAPYRDGHWAWIDPYGWTWVDNEPWGFAPFHYGRWAYVRDRWGWVPGPPVERAVYAPALVAFVGGSGLSLSVSIGGGNYNNGYGNGYDNGYDNGYGSGPVGWFPLGPRDIYRPPYQVSRGYFNNVNISNIRNVYVNKTVINNYYNGYAANPYAAAPTNVNYAYRNNPRAFTVVPRNVFAGARPVRPAVLRNIKPAMLAKATVAPLRIAPTNASLGIRRPARPIAAPVAKAFDRTVVARHAPPPPPVPFSARAPLIAKQNGAPLPVAQLREMRQARAKAEPQPARVRVVAAAPKPGAAPLPPLKPIAQGPRGLANHGLPNPAHAATAIRPIQVPVNPSKPNAPARNAPMRPGELPSARFAHSPRNGNLPQPAAIRPASPAAPAAVERGKPTTTPKPPANPRAVAPLAPTAAPANRGNGFVHAPRTGPQTAPQANATAQEGVKTDRTAKTQSRQAQQRAGEAHAQQQQAAQAQSKASAAQQAAQQHDAQARAAQQAARQHDAQARAAQQRADQARVQQQNASKEQSAVQARQQQQQAQQQADQARQQQQRASQEQAQQRAMQQQSQQRAAQEQQHAAAAQEQAQMRGVQAQQAQQRAVQAQPGAAQMQHAPQQSAPQSQQRPPPKKRKDEQQQNGGNRR